MKLSPDDPRLSAYLLGELSPDEAAAVEQAVAADPALGLVLRDLENTQLVLNATLSPGSTTLLPRQRETILRAARHADTSGKSTSLRALRKPLGSRFLLPIAAAAAIALTVFLLIRLPSGSSSNASIPPAEPDHSNALPLEVALLPAPGPADASLPKSSEARPTASSGLTKAADQQTAAMEKNGDLFLRKVAETLSTAPPPTDAMLPPLRPRGSVSALEHPTLRLPVHAGRASLGWIKQTILIDRKRPPAGAVRSEEILNHFSLRPTGAAAVSNGVTLSTESISCPWKPSATLLVVSIRGDNETSREVAATFKANTSSVRSYRLLGFAPVAGLKPAPLPTRLRSKTITSLVIEIEPSTATGDHGTIEWSVNGRSAPPVTVIRHGDAEPSDDARFAALVCAYAQWLVRESSGTINTEILAALARETASETLPANRMDFLNLIDRSLNL